MEKLITFTAGITFGMMFNQIYRYYYIKNLDHKIKTSINLDTSYEKLVKELNNKNILIASSISKITNNKSDSDLNTLLINTLIVPKDNEEKMLKFKIKETTSLNLETNSQDELILDLKRNPLLRYTIIDAPVLKVSQDFSKGTYLNRNLFRSIFKRGEKNKVDYGLIKDQRILIYGKISYINPNRYVLYPQILIGSGLVEFEGYVEYAKNKINIKLFNILLFMVGLTLIHYTYKTFFTPDKNVKK